MGFGDKPRVCKMVLILLILCFIIDLTGFVFSPWFSKESAVLEVNGTMYSGLLKSRNDTNLKDSDWFRAVFAYSFLSWYFFLHAVVVVIVYMFFSSDKVMFLMAMCWSIAGAFFALTAFATCARYSSGVLKEYSASFALTFISFILGSITGSLGIKEYPEVVGGK